jgi:hypothetical protein
MRRLLLGAITLLLVLTVGIRSGWDWWLTAGTAILVVVYFGVVSPRLARALRRPEDSGGNQ